MPLFIIIIIVLIKVAKWRRSIPILIMPYSALVTVIYIVNVSVLIITLYQNIYY